MNFQMFKLDLEQGEEPEIKLKASTGSLKKQESSRKHLLLLYWLTKAFDSVDHNKLWKFWKRWEYQTTWTASGEICMQVRKKQLELDMEQQIGSK